MRIAIVVSLILSVWLTATPTLANTVNEKLAQVEALRLDDYQAARTVLNTIDVEALSDPEFEQYQYLKAMLSTFDGDLLDTYQQYADLYQSAETLDIQVRTLTSQVSLTTYIGKWEEGFELANQLQKQLDSSLSDELKIIALNGLIGFYQGAGQQQIAQTLMERLKPLVEGDINQQCVHRVKQVEMQFTEDVSQLSLNTILDVKRMCESADNKFYALYVETYLFYYLVETGKTQQAMMLVEPLREKVENMDFLFLTTGLYAYVADLYIQLGRLEEAKEAAHSVLKLDTSGDYLPSKIQALESLITVAESRGNYQQAFHYLTKLEAARARFREASVVKQAAFQQANFELALKQSKIDLLDKRNRLLETQSALAKERVQSSMVALVFIGIILAGMLAWAYRSRKLQHKLKELARLDSLTGINNRGYFLQQAKKSLSKAEARHVTCSLILMDLDFFKRVNDTYGHQAGDWVLLEVVRAMQVVCDDDCLLGRMGGEEFGIFVSEADTSKGIALAEQCRAAIEGIDTSQSGYRFTLTASFGVSDTSQVGYRLENLSSASDLALYQSKQYGRNRVYEYDIDIARPHTST